MTINRVWEKYKVLRADVFCSIYTLSVVKKMCLALGMAALTGLSAQVRIVLPFTPIPITGQVFAVLLSGVLLGRWFGGISQMFYILLGVVGVPWFAGFRGGFLAVLEPSFGYILGFVFAAMFVGHFSAKFVKLRRFMPQFLLMLGGVVIIYFFGAMYLSLILRTSWLDTLSLAVLPFFIIDIIKAGLAASVSMLILPKVNG